MSVPERVDLLRLWIQRVRQSTLPVLSKKRIPDDRKSPVVRDDSVDLSETDSDSDSWESVSSELYTDPNPQILQITLPEHNDNRPYAWVHIYHHKIKGLLDSGSNRTLISTDLWKRLNTFKLHTPSDRLELRSADGGSMNIVGEIYIPFQFGEKTKIVPTLVIDDLLVDCLLGMTFWSRFHIYPHVQQCALTQVDENPLINSEPRTTLSASEDQQLTQIKSLFQVATPGCLPTTPLIEHSIEILDEWKSCPPIRQYPYTMSPKVREKVSDELDRMLRLGILERCHSDWSLNVVPVIKPTAKVRLCLDARKINERTVKDAYPLPHPGRILSQLPKARYLSTIDLSEAFLQIPLKKGSRRYTAFSIQGKGMFQFTRLPFGLVNSPATLSRLMDQVLGHGELEPHIFVYLDDIVIVSESYEEHLRLLDEVA